ncbi:LysR family transcriptional regulator [Vibrio superstes]|uniref:LysR family transcriptional regulator n=1 Tax=Vibrio superstes NBRC 103154 TaxID=1219062 RepID=A0A511QNH1_9VIBR|nr:LysR family transcriptional regulator [Vibrio superstes]GEM78893.1 LysR family transcriptional regulator [Vibrio superstes NBRC 103154]
MDISQLDIQSLIVLKTLLEEKHVSNTAHHMNLSQSTVSRALQKMRALFADELLVRTHTGYELTTKAESLRADINLVINSLEVLAHKQSFSPKDNEATVRFFGLHPQMNTLMPKVIKRIRETAPKMTVSIDTSAQRHFESLNAGDVHFVLSSHQPSNSEQSLYKMKLADRDFRLVMNKEHPLANKDITPEMLLKAQFGQISLQGEKTLSFEHKFVELGLVDKKNRLSIPIQVSHFSSVANIAAETDTVFHVPTSYAQDICSDERLIGKPVPKELQLDFEAVYLFWHKRFHEDPMCQWVRSIFKELYSDNPTVA